MSAHFTVIFIGIRYVESVIVKRHWRLLLLLLFWCPYVLPLRLSVLLPTWLWRCCPWMNLRTGCWTSWPAAAPLWASRCLTPSMPFVWPRSETGELNHTLISLKAQHQDHTAGRGVTSHSYKPRCPPLPAATNTFLFWSSSGLLRAKHLVKQLLPPPIVVMLPHCCSCSYHVPSDHNMRCKACGHLWVQLTLLLPLAALACAAPHRSGNMRASSCCVSSGCTTTQSAWPWLWTWTWLRQWPAALRMMMRCAGSCG